MSTLGSLPALAIAQYQPSLAPFDYGRALTQANQIAGGQVNNQSALLQLDELKRQQATAALAREYSQANPGALLGGDQAMPPSTLGAPGPGAITQAPLAGMPGQPQTVAAPPDLSQFATGQPPQSTLGMPGTQPRANPMEALVRQNPDAALQVLGQQQQLQETRLAYRTKILD